MKKIALIALPIALLLMINACKKKTSTEEPKYVTFEMPYVDTGVIPAEINTLMGLVPAGTYFPFPAQTFPTLTDELLASYGTTRDKISKLVLKSVNIKVTNNPSQALDFIDSVKVFLDNVAETNPTLCAYKYNFPLGLRDMNLDIVPDNDIKDYFEPTEVKIIMGGTKRAGQTSVEANTILLFNAKFEITARVN
jgi:hypothetical protein